LIAIGETNHSSLIYNELARQLPRAVYQGTPSLAAGLRQLHESLVVTVQELFRRIIDDLGWLAFEKAVRLVSPKVRVA
jgi:hypothetical protein